MSAPSYTPILLYGSTTASAVPLAANLTTSASGVELAINAYDGKLFYKDAGGTVQVLGVKMPSGILPIANGGTNSSATPTAGALAYGTGTAYGFTAAGTSGQVLTSAGSGTPTWTSLSSIGVTTFSAGTTGFTPSTATSGAVTLAGTLATTNGGTGLTSFTANGVVYASSTSALATGSALTFDGTTLNLGNATNTYSGKFITKSGVSDGYAFATDNTVYQYLSAISSGVAIVGTATNHPYSFAINGSEQMRLTSTGLGIGTSSPNKKLTAVNNASGLQGASFYNSNNAAADGSGIEFGKSSADPFARVWSNHNSGTLYFDTAATFQFAWRNTMTGTPNVLMNLDGSGNLGIGTSSPGAKLQVNAGAAGVQSIFGYSGGDNYIAIGNNSNASYILRAGYNISSEYGYLQAYAANTSTPDDIVINPAGGNLGLGVTPSAWAGYSGVLQSKSASLASSGVEAELSSNCYYNSGWKFGNASSTYAHRYEQYNGAHAWFTSTAAGVAPNPITFTQAMTLDASGRLLVGTTTAVSTVTSSAGAADGTTGFSGSFHANTGAGGDAYVQLGGARSSGLASGAVSIINAKNSFGNGQLTFQTEGTERARIDSSGNLLVGQTGTAYQNSDSFCLDKINKAVYVNHINGTTTGYAYAGFGYNAVSIGSITQSGTTAVLYNVTSDQRLKENIVDAAPASDLIDSLQVRQFDWKSDGTHQRYGFVAQELVAVAPEAVHQPADPEEMMAVDYSKLVPMLVKEIQSLRTRLAALEAK